MDNFSSKKNKYFIKKKKDYKEKNFSKFSKEEIGSTIFEKGNEQKSVFLKKSEISKGRISKKLKKSGILKKDKILDWPKKSKKYNFQNIKQGNYLGNMMKKKKNPKMLNSKNSSRHDKKLNGKVKSSKLLKRSNERSKRIQEEKKKLKFSKFDWKKLNKKFSSFKAKNTKKKKTESIDFTKSGLNRNISAKHFKSQVAQTARHKREKSLERFREELQLLKKGLNLSSKKISHKSQKSQISSLRNKRGHHKTKSEFSLGVTYFTKLDKKGQENNSSQNYLKLRRKSGGQLDFDYLSSKNNIMSKKSVEKTSKNLRRIQFENIYKNRFSNLKNEMKIFKTQRKSKPITFTAHFSGTLAQNKRQKKYLAKQNKHRVGSMTNMKLMKMAKKAQASLFESKILNKLGGSTKRGLRKETGSKRGRHKYTRSEPEKLLGLRFLKKKEKESKELDKVGGRRDSHPFNTHRGKRGQSIGNGQPKLIYSSRNHR